LQGRVTGSHLTSMHSMDNYYVSKLLPLMREAGLHAVANPLINITLQGRHDSYPKRRGMTRVPELLAAGINVAFGHDCVMDPWYPLGSADMLEVAAMGLHVAQMTRAMRQCFDAVTVNAHASWAWRHGLELIAAPTPAAAGLSPARRSTARARSWCVAASWCARAQRLNSTCPHWPNGRGRTRQPPPSPSGRWLESNWQGNSTNTR
jgi:cytosine/adenosine deaminase-related metal-dependent hydrolase